MSEYNIDDAYKAWIVRKRAVNAAKQLRWSKNNPDKTRGKKKKPSYQEGRRRYRERHREENAKRLRLRRARLRGDA